MKKQKMLILPILIVVSLLLAGCGIRGLKMVGKILEDPPEGYVYDYQISMKPIPEEVAGYGGEVYGTIHAFPSKIKLELMRRNLNTGEYEDIKVRVKECVKKITEDLEKEYGGEFSAELIDIIEESWYFLCVNKSTGDEFLTIYENYSFYYQKDCFVDYILMDTYMVDEDIREKVRKVENIVDEVFGEQVTAKVHIQKYGESSDKSMCIYIAVFSEEVVNILEEQKKIKQLWDKLTEQGKETYNDINIKYFPLEYKDVIEKKYEEGNFADLVMYASNEKEKKWLNRGEMHAIFSFSETNCDEIESCFALDDDEIWKYWILKEK